MFASKVILKLQQKLLGEIPQDDYNLAAEIDKLALNAYKKGNGRSLTLFALH